MVRILVVEDDPDVCDVLTRTLRRAGHTVWSASNGADAVMLAQEQQPDLILMDLVLPIMGGLEATRRLKADERTAHIPVLALSGRGLADDEARARAAGCDGFISKPCGREQLLAQVAAFAGRGRTVGARGSACGHDHRAREPSKVPLIGHLFLPGAADHRRDISRAYALCSA